MPTGSSSSPNPILTIGTHCAAQSCPTVDFLPTPCPHCSLVFCGDHIRAHDPCAVSGLRGSRETHEVAGPSGWRARRGCDVRGCEERALEGVAGRLGQGSEEESVEGDGTSRKESGTEESDKEAVARRVRCEGCGGAYCARHRAQTQHACTAPLAHEARHLASIQRHEHAREVIAANFPQHASRVIPKPPPPPAPRVRLEPEQRKSGSSASIDSTSAPVSVNAATGSAKHTSGTTTTNLPPAPAEKPAKSRDEKLWDLHVRKIRTAAVSLDGKPMEVGDRRFFEWEVANIDEVKEWERTGKWGGKKLDRAWVGKDMSAGRAFDLIVDKTKTPRPKEADPAQALGLINLSAAPPHPRSIQPLVLSQTIFDQVKEGTSVVLVRGWLGQ